ncbi:MAG: asparaginase [Clostridiales bacterium]|nr:asparaginase [Clostridiales bacterium]
MKKIAVIFNGGTISMKIDEEINAAVPSLKGEEIMRMIKGIENYAEIESYNFSTLPSPQVTPEIMFNLSKLVEELVNRQDIYGVVITHGTDTLEETAYFLDLVVDTNKPIVVTGAMRNSSELGYDGPFNLATSICAALSEEAIGRGVLICFNGELNSAKDVTKVNSMALDAFKTPSFGPIGIVDNNVVLFYRKSVKSQKLKINFLESKVALIKCGCGMDSDFLNFIIENNYKGVIIEGFGRGNVPKEMVPGIKKCIAAQIPVVLVSRCFEGRVYHAYGYEGGGLNLRNIGVIFGDNMQGQKARIKLMVAISYNNNMDFVKSYMEEGLYENN